jgi:hypothetical protein
MNERIQELFDQAKVECFKMGSKTATTVGYDELEKFAQLVVRECIECTKEWRDAVRAGSTRDYSRGYVHGCDDAIVEMKTRFGVEE